MLTKLIWNDVRQNKLLSAATVFFMTVSAMMLGLTALLFSGLLGSVNALMEQYPTLYSSVSMEYFQRTIFDAEEHLQAARRLYNANVSLYNQTLASIPWSLVAALCRMEPADFYEVEEHKKNFKVSFD